MDSNLVHPTRRPSSQTIDLPRGTPRTDRLPLAQPPLPRDFEVAEDEEPTLVPENLSAPSELSAVFGVIHRSAFADAIKPTQTSIDDERARHKELSLMRAPAVDDEAAPPARAAIDSVTQTPAGAGWAAPNVSGVRPAERKPLATFGRDVRVVQPSPFLGGPELLRARAMVRISALTSLVAAGLLQVIEPTFDLAHWLVTGISLVVVAGSLWLEFVFAVHQKMRRNHHLILGFSVLLSIVCVLAHTGPASPVALLAALLAHHYAGSGRRVETYVVPAVAASSILTLGALSAAGFIHPTGPFVIAATTTLAWSACLSLFVILAATLSHHRVTRLAESTGRARTRVGRREALIDEAYAHIGMLRIPLAGEQTGNMLGRFGAGRVIGRTHRAEVYAGRAEDGQSAAVKLFEPTLDRNEGLAAFHAASAASAVSPSFARTLDYGALRCGRFFIATEILSGPDLGTQLREPLAMSNTESLILLDEVAEALDRAHRNRLVHGNLKPENVVRDLEGRWRITDFGTPPSVLAQSVLAPRYTAPEYGRQPLDARADVFSLAALAYRLIVRCPPSCEHDPFEVGDRRPVRPTAIAPVPAEVDAVFALGLAIDPDLRLSSVTEFVAALRSALDGKLPAPLRARAAQFIDGPWARDASP